MSQPEAQLKTAIVDALRRCGYFVRRNEVGSRRNKAFGMGQGSADLFVLVKPTGRAVFLEVKTPDGKVTANQRAFGEDVQEHGGAYFVVTSVGEALQAVRAAGKRCV